MYYDICMWNFKIILPGHVYFYWSFFRYFQNSDTISCFMLCDKSNISVTTSGLTIFMILCKDSVFRSLWGSLRKLAFGIVRVFFFFCCIKTNYRYLGCPRKLTWLDEFSLSQWNAFHPSINWHHSAENYFIRRRKKSLRRIFFKTAHHKHTRGENQIWLLSRYSRPHGATRCVIFCQASNWPISKQKKIPCVDRICGSCRQSRTETRHEQQRGCIEF